MQETKNSAAQKKYSTGIQRLTLIGILASFGIILHFIEALLPAIFPVPGAKLGLANIITLMALVVLGPRGGGQVLLLRIFLGSFLAGTFMTLSFFLSISGGLLAFLAMALAFKLKAGSFSLIGISILGALAHNLGQIIAVAFIIGNLGVFYYLPVLTLLALPTGVLVGLAASYSLKAIPGMGWGK